MDLSALHTLSYGVYVVTSKWENEFSGCAITTAMQLTGSEPYRMMVAINKENYTHELIHKSKKANISVLNTQANLELIGHFGFRTGRQYDKLQKVELKNGKNNVPFLTQNTIAYFETKVINEVDVGTHTVFILELEEAEKLGRGEPLTYEYYHRVIKGTTPPKASSYIAPHNG